ncbi:MULTISPECIES: hypothetical protein [unclassified Lentimonas]|uniref:hypothetical protein n=1 Tax=unclassified Lentimonas TaxID=2630993 RepID=UPI00132C975F|nr:MULTISPECIES: hypothetical protein [unclassified Lentimonas]CAA6678621.1 Unannotated [Lentimonas sp. CC4]CAA6685853.1 Unannotated [Lentimonas sp. CC6]CAA6693504.1 Unannotated [Lentimonas sp. CC19]CAA6695839.1 Unannotated [Lentimonas sp. CC10]CAA7069759.1 Unannotated [Lentimonas sp. CC11]
MSQKQKYAPLDRQTKQLRYLGYLYILMLIFEGALRKWFLPGLSDVLLLARDPIVLVAYLIALSTKRFPSNKYVISGFALMFVWILSSLLTGHGNLIVLGFGFRANFFHIPFAFILGKVFFRSDVITIGRYWIWGSVAMTALIVLQFYSPQTTWINRAPGGLEGGGFSGALGRFRPPGTFSFIVGIVWFYTFTAAFLISGITQHKRYGKLLLGAGSIALILAIPVSISRSLMLAVTLTLLTGMLTSIFQKGAILRYLRICLAACVALLIAGQFSVFDESKDAFLKRWDQSTAEQYGGVTGSIIGRTMEEFSSPFIRDEEMPFLGEGIGAGTQVGVKLLTGSRGFKLGEQEWLRITAEGGLLLGTMYIAWRVWLTVALGHIAFTAFRKGNGMGLIFLSATAYNLLIGQFGQSTINGFTVIGIGLTIACMRPREIITINTDDGSSTSTTQKAATANSHGS